MSIEHPSFGKLDDDRVIIFDTTLRDGEQSPGFSMNLKEKLRMAEALAELGVPSDTSMANFILARFASVDEAEACDKFLQSQGLIVRRVASYNLPHCLRITIGDEAACRRVAHAIGQFKGAK